MPRPTVPRAVLFDLDGTLYRQTPLRRRMLVELGLAPLRGPRRAWRTVRRLRAFRSAREELRGLGRADEPLEELQYTLPARRLGEDPATMRATVVEWIHRRPLRHLPPTARPGLRATLADARARGVALGVFSDYPAAEKLAALGVDDLFDVVVGATEPEVNAFKPHPRGFEVGAERLGCAPGEALYVGDRADVDGTGARAAGMPFALVSGSRDGGDAGDATVHGELREALRVVLG